MTGESAINSEQIVEKTAVKKPDWWYLSAVIFMFSGMSAIIMGLIFTILMWLIHQDTVQFSLQNITNFLFYLSLPMLFFGACCLDKIEEKKKLMSQNRFR
jgi:hypothetical protein